MHYSIDTQFHGSWFVPFRYFVVSSFRLALWHGEKTIKRHAKKRTNEKKNAKRKKKRNNARRKDEITKSFKQKDNKQVKREKTKKAPFEVTPFKTPFLSFRLASFRNFVFSPGIIACYCFCCFVFFSPGVFVISHGVFSLFRLFAWRLFVISSLRLAFFRLFAYLQASAKWMDSFTRMSCRFIGLSETTFFSSETMPDPHRSCLRAGHVNTLVWTFGSPDLSPIKRLMDILGRRVHDLYSFPAAALP